MLSKNFCNYPDFKTQNGNIIWGCCFDSCLEKLLDISLIKFEEQEAETFSRQCPFDSSEISQDSIFKHAGKGQQAVDFINYELMQKFPQVVKNDEFLSDLLLPQQVISFAMIYKKISFAIKFERRTSKTFKFKGQVVDSFFAKTEEQKQIITINSYQDEDNFTVSIKDMNTSDYLYLVKTDKNEKTGSIIQKVMELEKEEEGIEMDQSDEFQMPVLNIDEQRQLKEIQGASIISPKELQGIVVAKIFESVKLKIDQSGATVENFGIMETDQSGIFGYTPKSLLLNKPFWLVMKQKGSHPYLCIYINAI